VADVDDRAVLDVAARADADVVDVAAQHAAGPHRDVIAQRHVADHGGGRVHVDALAQHGRAVEIGAQVRRMHGRHCRRARRRPYTAPMEPRPCSTAALQGDPDTPVADLAPTLDALRNAWQARKPDYAQRRDDLRALRAALKAGLPRMVEAIASDFGHRPQHESLLAEAMPVLSTIDMMLGNLRGWMRPRRVSAGWRLWPARAQLRNEPLGVVGV